MANVSFAIVSSIHPPLSTPAMNVIMDPSRDDVSFVVESVLRMPIIVVSVDILSCFVPYVFIVFISLGEPLLDQLIHFLHFS